MQELQAARNPAGSSPAKRAASESSSRLRSPTSASKQLATTAASLGPSLAPIGEATQALDTGTF